MAEAAETTGFLMNLDSALQPMQATGHSGYVAIPMSGFTGAPLPAPAMEISTIRGDILNLHRIIAEQAARIKALEDKTSLAALNSGALHDSYIVDLT